MALRRLFTRHAVTHCLAVLLLVAIAITETTTITIDTPKP